MLGCVSIRRAIVSSSLRVDKFFILRSGAATRSGVGGLLGDKFFAKKSC